jgi:hypothetical protein
MKLEIGKALYPLPAHWTIISVNVVHNDARLLVQAVDQKEMNKIIDAHPGVLGAPTHFCVAKRSILFFPAPDQEYEARIRYVPPATEL